MLQTALNNFIRANKCLIKMPRFYFVQAGGMQVGGEDCCGGGCSGNC